MLYCYVMDVLFIFFSFFLFCFLIVSPSLSILPRDTFDSLHTPCPLFGPLFFLC